jgi:hypothetical protein
MILTRPTTRWRSLAVVLVVLPAVVVLYELHRLSGHNAPAGDFALIELQVRDVGRYLVDLGPYSRFGWNHPGPLLYFALAPFYRLFAGSSIGAAVGAVAINSASLGATVAIARRYRSAAFGVAIALGLLLLVRAMGEGALNSVWNPTITVLPLGLLVVLVWAIALGDAGLWPWAVLVGSFLVQSHVGTVPIVGALGVWLGAVSLRSTWTTRHAPRDRNAPAPEPGDERSRLHRRATRRTIVLSALVAVVAWALPVWQQLTTSDGNLTKLLAFTRETGTDRYGAALHVLFNQFRGEPEWLFGAVRGASPSLAATMGALPVPWLLLPVIAAVVIAMRKRYVVELRLFGAIGAGLFGAWLGTARIYGAIFVYLVTWTWVLGMLMVVTAGYVIARACLSASWQRRPAIALATLTLVAASLGVANAARAVETQLPQDQSIIRALTPAVIRTTAPGSAVRFSGGTSQLGDRVLNGLALQAERADRRLAQPPRLAYVFGRHRVTAEPAVQFVVATAGTPPADYRGAHLVAEHQGVRVYRSTVEAPNTR